jgi:hypothetical protein
MLLSDRGPGRTAKPLFIGSIPIAASNLLNNLDPVPYSLQSSLYFHSGGGAGRLVPGRSVCNVIFEDK